MLNFNMPVFADETLTFVKTLERALGIPKETDPNVI